MNTHLILDLDRANAAVPAEDSLLSQIPARFVRFVALGALCLGIFVLYGLIGLHDGRPFTDGFVLIIMMAAIVLFFLMLFLVLCAIDRLAPLSQSDP